jgi:5-methylcytosine-specific restriction endonuclease McrA
MSLAGIRKHPGRGGYAWEQVRRQVLANASVCHLCGQALDFGARPRSRWSPSVDHILSIKAMRLLDPKEQRRLALDPQNLRPCHYGCNSARGSGGKPQPRRTSRKW